MIRYRIGGLLLLLAAAYLLGEAWAVAGWQGRPYRWTVDAISSLGVPEVLYSDLGASTESTRHVAMNANFISSGLRVVLAGLVLAPFIPRPGRWAILPLVVIHGVGTVIVGLFPAGITAVRANMHGLGAVMAIVGGAALLVAITVVVARRFPALGALTAVCAAISIAGCVMAFAGVGGFGLAERLAVDAVIVWQVLVGALVLATRPPRDPVPASDIHAGS